MKTKFSDLAQPNRLLPYVKIVNGEGCGNSVPFQIKINEAAAHNLATR